MKWILHRTIFTESSDSTMPTFTFHYPQQTWCPRGVDETFICFPTEYFLEQIRERTGAEKVDSDGTMVIVTFSDDATDRYDTYVAEGIKHCGLTLQVTPEDRIPAAQMEKEQAEAIQYFDSPYVDSHGNKVPPPFSLKRTTCREWWMVPDEAEIDHPPPPPPLKRTSNLESWMSPYEKDSQRAPPFPIDISYNYPPELIEWMNTNLELDPTLFTLIGDENV